MRRGLQGQDPRAREALEGVHLGQGSFFPGSMSTALPLLGGEEVQGRKNAWGWGVVRGLGAVETTNRQRGPGAPGPPPPAALLFLAGVQGQRGRFLRKWRLAGGPSGPQLTP